MTGDRYSEPGGNSRNASVICLEFWNCYFSCSFRVIHHTACSPKVLNVGSFSISQLLDLLQYIDHMNQVHTFPHFLEISFNIIVQCAPWCFPTEMLYSFLISPWPLRAPPIFTSGTRSRIWSARSLCDHSQGMWDAWGKHETHTEMLNISVDFFMLKGQQNIFRTLIGKRT